MTDSYAVSLREMQILEANHGLYSLENAVDNLHCATTNPTGRQMLVEDFARLEAAQDKLAAVVEIIKNAIERQQAKANDPQFQHLIAAE